MDAVWWPQDFRSRLNGVQACHRRQKHWIANREPAFFVGEFKGVLIPGTNKSYRRVTLSCEIPEGSWLVADGHKAEVLDDDKFHEENEVS